MSPALVISRRELRTYFNSPVAYIVVSVFTIITGYLFFTQLFMEQQAELRGFFGSMPLLFMFLAPAITMRLLADEKASGTLELLITMPVRDWEVVVGKFLAAMGLLCAALGLTLVFAITVRALGPLDRGPAIGGYVGLLLMGGAYVAIGVMCSAFTRNSIVSFIVAFAISFALFLFGHVVQFVPQKIQPLIAFLSISSHIENISRGVIDTRDVINYV
jgi:ABC-2 type transport system permease protein